MSDLRKLDFNALELSGKNYLEWVVELKTHLRARDLLECIEENNQTSEKQKSQVMEIMRHHIKEGLKTEYLNLENPLDLWKALKSRYEHRREFDLPRAQYEWTQLRFQDFKSVNDYNSELHRITAIKEACGEKVTDKEKIDKTLSTFHPDRMLISSSFRQHDLKNFGDLISKLNMLEEYDQLLIRNHELRPTGSRAPPEVNVNTFRGRGNPNRGRGRGFGRGRGRGGHDNNGRGHGRGQGKDGNRFHPYNRGNRVWIRDGSQNRNENSGNRNDNPPSVCHRCGSDDHFYKQCRTPQHLVDLYQASLKGKMKSVETNITNLESGEGTSEKNISSFHTSDFFDDLDLENFINSTEDLNENQKEV